MKVRNEVELKTCHDIRHWKTCVGCGGLGDDRKMLNYKGALHHGACLVELIDRKHILTMPDSELAKFTLEAAGVPLMKALLARHDKRLSRSIKRDAP
jgi:hypothetical protein